MHHIFSSIKDLLNVSHATESISTQLHRNEKLLHSCSLVGIFLQEYMDGKQPAKSSTKREEIINNINGIIVTKQDPRWLKL